MLCVLRLHVRCWAMASGVKAGVGMAVGVGEGVAVGAGWGNRTLPAVVNGEAVGESDRDGVGTRVAGSSGIRVGRGVAVDTGVAVKTGVDSLERACGSCVGGASAGLGIEVGILQSS